MAFKKIDTKKNGTYYVKEFEEILEESSIVSFNEKTIVVPGIVVFTTKKNDGLAIRTLFSKEEFVEVDESSFQNMLETIKKFKQSDYVITTESKTIPKRMHVINLKEIKREAVLVRADKDILVVNDRIFTNSELEFHGSGMFTSKEVYFVTFEQMNKIKEILLLPE